MTGGEMGSAGGPGGCRVVGLAGGIASGKSTVAGHLRSLGAPVLDADRLARRVVAPGRPALAAIARAFGAEFLTARGELDRAALGARVFGDAGALATLNGITHPAIRALAEEEVAALARRGARWVVYEAALLAEGGEAAGDGGGSLRPSGRHPALWVGEGRAGLGGGALSPALAELVVVTAPWGERLRRIMARDGLPEERARARLDSQVSDDVRLRVATVVLRNEGDPRALEGASRALYDLLVERHGEPLGAGGPGGAGRRAT